MPNSMLYLNMLLTSICKTDCLVFLHNRVPRKERYIYKFHSYRLLVGSTQSHQRHSQDQLKTQRALHPWLEHQHCWGTHYSSTRIHLQNIHSTTPLGLAEDLSCPLTSV